MENKKIQDRIDEIKKENDEINKKFQELENTKQQLISTAMINNGRIMELTTLLTKPDTKKKG